MPRDKKKKKKKREVKEFLSIEEKKEEKIKKEKKEKLKTIVSAILMTIFGLFLLIPISGINIYDLLREKTEILATVNGKDITIGEVRYYLRLSDMRKPPNMSEQEFYKQVVSRMIQSKLIKDEAESIGYDVSKVRIYLTFRRFFSNEYGEFNYNIYKQWLSRVGIDESHAYDYIREYLIVSDFTQDIGSLITVPDYIATEVGTMEGIRVSFNGYYISKDIIKRYIDMPTQEEINRAIENEKKKQKNKDINRKKIIDKIIDDRISVKKNQIEGEIRGVLSKAGGLEVIKAKYNPVQSASKPSKIYGRIDFENPGIPSISSLTVPMDVVWDEFLLSSKDSKYLGPFSVGGGLVILEVNRVEFPQIEGALAKSNVEREISNSVFNDFIRKLYEKSVIEMKVSFGGRK